MQVLTFNWTTIIQDIKKSPDWKKYVPIQESKDIRFIPFNEDRIELYENLGFNFDIVDLKEMKFDNLVLDSVNKQFFNDDIVVCALTQEGVRVMSGQNLIVKSIQSNCTHLPVLFLD